VRSHNSLVCLQVGRATAQALHIDTPFLGVQAESLQSTLLAEYLDSIDVLVATIVTGARVSLRVFVRHGRAESVEDCARSDIFGGDEEDRLALALDLFLL
jgi:hypothetical protein